jgi:hypothetical protein
MHREWRLIQAYQIAVEYSAIIFCCGSRETAMRLKLPCEVGYTTESINKTRNSKSAPAIL